MWERKIAAVLVALLFGVGAAACGGGEVDPPQGGPGQSQQEDPTLGDAEGGGTPDRGGADAGRPPNGPSDAGSGTGSGR